LKTTVPVQEGKKIGGGAKFAPQGGEDGGAEDLKKRGQVDRLTKKKVLRKKALNQKE